MNLKLYARSYTNTSTKLIQSPRLHSPPSPNLQFTLPLLSPLDSPRSHPSPLPVLEKTHPDDSLYSIQVQFPERPKTSHLSGLTLKENQKTLNQSRSLNRVQQSSSRVFKDEPVCSMPTDQDFFRILSKLEMVTLNRTAGTRRILVSEGEGVEIMLEVGVIQYFVVNCKGKTPPMVGNVKVSRGKVVCYASRMHSEPSKDICEVVSRTDCFQVKDVSSKFRCEVIYVGVEALVDSTFNISVTFGQPLAIKTNKNLRANQEEQEIIEQPERKIIIKKKKKPINGTDFIKLNIENSKKNIVKNLLNSNWQMKRESALQRKKFLLQTKQQRTLGILTRSYRSCENIFKPPSDLQNFWFSFLIFQKSISLLNSLRLKK